jgi:hypothetical protein
MSLFRRQVVGAEMLFSWRQLLVLVAIVSCFEGLGITPTSLSVLFRSASE